MKIVWAICIVMAASLSYSISENATHLGILGMRDNYGGMATLTYQQPGANYSSSGNSTAFLGWYTNETIAVSFVQSNSGVTQTPALANQTVQWAFTTTVTGTGTCTYSISQLGVQSAVIKDAANTTISNGAALPSLSWACSTSGSPYSITFQTEQITQTQSSVEYTSIVGSIQDRFLLSMVNNQSIIFNFTHALPSSWNNLNLYLCTSTTNASCNQSATWTQLGYSLANNSVQYQLTLASNETVLIAAYYLPGGGGGGGGQIGGNQSGNLSSPPDDVPPIAAAGFFDWQQFFATLNVQQLIGDTYAWLLFYLPQGPYLWAFIIGILLTIIALRRRKKKEKPMLEVDLNG